MRTIRKRILGLEFEAHPVVFPASAGLLVVFVVLTAMEPRRALMLFNQCRSGIAEHFSGLYVLSMTGFLLFAIWLACSRYGRIRLGADDERPEFPTLTWFAMLFSAGMGIGMLFFGVAEPLFHLAAPPAGAPGTQEAARQAMGITLFHWCLHPWGLYAVVALSLAYFGFRRGLPLSFRSVFHPLLGERIHGRIGDAIDTMAVLATLFGLATSLGLGAKQVNAGLHHVFGLPQGPGIQAVLIACITALALVSLISGLHVGIRRLSELNMLLAGSLLVFLFVFGPTVHLAGALVDNLGAYLQDLPRRSFWTAARDTDEARSWLGGWTVFYWGWWIAWSPFVGMFIARVSRGRTIREFVAGVLIVPSAVAVVWMTGFGSAALHQETGGGDTANADSLEATAGEQLHDVLVRDEEHGLPLAEDGALVAPDARGVASPRGIRVEAREDGAWIAAERGVPVEYQHGALVEASTGRPYEPSPGEIHSGRYRAEGQDLSLGGYLSAPVLDATHTRRQDTTATAMFIMLEAYPLAWLTALIATLSVILFFVTSSDSASMVADMIASGGSPDPALGTRLFWGILEGILAAVLLAAGGLVALQTGSISLGLPFCIVIILMCVSLYVGLRREGRADIRTSDDEVSGRGGRI